jgi:hypothetical protein
VTQKRFDADAEAVRKALGDALGLRVHAVPDSPDHKSPDLLIEVGKKRIVVEVERKADDQQLRDLLDSDEGTILQYSGDRVEDRIRNAWRQIRDYPHRSPSDSTLIWLIAGQRDATILTGTAAVTRVYGIETLEGYTAAGEYYSTPCYFFYDSVFFRYKDLDAVVVQSHEALSLCLNPYSPRYTTWKEYAFLGAFSVIDPAAEESDGQAFLADCDHDRRDTNGVVRYLREKYQLRAPTINQYVLVNCPVEPQEQGPR